MTLRRRFWPALIVPLVLVLLLPISPLYRPIPSDDPSVYLYAGQRLLEGAAPYREVWDHKQPLAFVLFAIAQVLTPGSLWGIWLLEVVGLCAAGWLADGMLKPVASRGARALAVLAGLLTLSIILWTYSLEELSLPLQLFILWAFTRWLRAGAERGRFGWAFGMGAATGLAFFLKQSLIAAGVAVGLYLLGRLLVDGFDRQVRDRLGRRSLFGLLGLAAGFLSVALPVVAWLALRGALPAYRDAAFAFNLAYAGLGPLERVNAALDAVEFMGGTPGLFLVFALWLGCLGVALAQMGPALARLLCARGFRPVTLAGGAGLVLLSLAGEALGGQAGLGLAQMLAIGLGAGLLALGGLASVHHLRDRLSGWLGGLPVFSITDDSARVRQALFFLAALYLPIALFLITLSGRNYVYYFIPLIPLLILALGLLAGTFLQGARGATLFFGALGLALAYNPLLLTLSGLQAQRNPPLPSIVEYVRQHTTPDQTILVWGKFVTHTYFLTDRRAPTRFFYQAPLALDDYNARFGIADELLGDVQKAPPALFLYNAEADAPGAAVPDAGRACPLNTGDAPNSVGRVFAFVCENYQYTGPVEGFWVFEKK